MLRDLAIEENRPDDVLEWHDRLAARGRTGWRSDDATDLDSWVTEATALLERSKRYGAELPESGLSQLATRLDANREQLYEQLRAESLGLLVAGDPVSTIPYVGVEAGMVIVSAGDPSCATSPNEQDQRHLGPMLHIPVLDPATPQEAFEHLQSELVRLYLTPESSNDGV